LAGRVDRLLVASRSGLPLLVLDGEHVVGACRTGSSTSRRSSRRALAPSCR
jgi:hypothetical protein